MLLVVSTVRGTSVAFHWPAIIRRGKHHSHVRYYSSTDGELVHEDEAKSRSNVASDSDDVLSDSMSASSEDSFNEEAALVSMMKKALFATVPHHAWCVIHLSPG